MLVGMVFGRLGGVMGRMKPVPLSDMGVVRRFLMIAGVMVLGSFEMMSCCVFVVFGRHLVVRGTFVFRHDVSFVNGFARGQTRRMSRASQTLAWSVTPVPLHLDEPPLGTCGLRGRALLDAVLRQQLVAILG